MSGALCTVSINWRAPSAVRGGVVLLPSAFHGTSKSVAGTNTETGTRHEAFNDLKLGFEDIYWSQGY
jgi:hypothetical protein